MASPLQNRLVGTLILVALAVIILPDVLDGEKTEAVAEFETIPLQPEHDQTLQPAETIPADVKADIAAANPDNQDNSQAEAVTETAAEAQPIDDSSTLKAPPREPQEFAADGDSYVIQLGAFSNRESVEKLVSQLQQKGFAAYSERSGELTKLMVGPDTSKAELEKQLSALNELTGLQGKVLNYSL